MYPLLLFLIEDQRYATFFCVDFANRFIPFASSLFGFSFVGCVLYGAVLCCAVRCGAVLGWAGLGCAVFVRAWERSLVLPLRETRASEPVSLRVFSSLLLLEFAFMCYLRGGNRTSLCLVAQITYGVWDNQKHGITTAI